MRVLPSGRLVRALHVLIAVLAIHAVAFAIAAAGSAQPASDFDRYYEIGSTPGRPYVDYQVEHPIGTLVVFRALGRLPGGRASFGLGVVVLDLIADAIIVGALLWGWGIAAAAYGAAALVPVIGLFFNRIDAWSTAAAILAVAAWRRDRPIVLGCALAIGAAFKLWPIVLATLLIVPWRHRRSIAAVTAFAITAALFGGAGGVARRRERRAAGVDLPRRHRLADREPGREPGPPHRLADAADGERRMARRHDQRHAVDRDVHRGRADLRVEQLARGAARPRRRRDGWRACRRCCCSRRCCPRSM